MEDAEEAQERTDRILISNIVITCSLNQSLDLDEVAWRFHGEYNPSTFAAVQLRLAKPQTTALVFSTGKCVVTGARSEMAAFVAVQLFYAMLKVVHPALRITEQNIQNIVSSSSLGKCLAVDQMAKKFCISSHYDPELFPGLRLSLEKPAVKILLFVKGRVVVTGGRSREDIAAAWRILRGCVKPFLVDKDLTHTDIVTTRGALRRRKVADEDDEEIAAMLGESLDGLQ